MDDRKNDLWKPPADVRAAIARGDRALAKHRAALTTDSGEPSELVIEFEEARIRRLVAQDCREAAKSVRGYLEPDGPWIEEAA